MSLESARKVATIVSDAGGRIVGRTKLQKIAFLLSTSGLEEGFPFVYKHYGPYSEDLAAASKEANLLGFLIETEQVTAWGGTYSTYNVNEPSRLALIDARRRLASEAAAADAIELELAATAVFLAKEGNSEPWQETARRKPEKAAQGRLEKARQLYRRLASIQTPVAWPVI
jgi:uncharacterized protein YwgA